MKTSGVKIIFLDIGGLLPAIAGDMSPCKRLLKHSASITQKWTLSIISFSMFMKSIASQSMNILTGLFLIIQGILQKKISKHLCSPVCKITAYAEMA